jgi:hypothetical protein
MSSLNVLTSITVSLGAIGLSGNIWNKRWAVSWTYAMMHMMFTVKHFVSNNFSTCVESDCFN